MSDKNVRQTAMAKDTIVYMLAKVMEGLIGVLTISLYTYFFEKSNLGRYTTINITVTTFAMICIQWLSQSTYRYVNDYEKNNKSNIFYSTVVYSWACLNAVIIAVLGIGILAVTYLFPMGSFLKEFPPNLLWLALLCFVTFNTAQLAFSMLAAKRETKFILIISVCSITAKLLITIYLVKTLGPRIEWVLMSNALCDGAVSVLTAFKLKLFHFISFKDKSNEVLKTFGIYGIPLIGNLITTAILNNSDRYLIGHYYDQASVAVYSTNYSIVSSSFTMIAAAIMRGSYPTIISVWNEGKKDSTVELIAQTVRAYLLIIVPAVVGVSVLSKTVATLLFEKNYTEGHSVMMWVALSLMFLGLTEYSNKLWELTANTKIIFRNSFIAGIVNIILNIIFIPRFGYKAAAVTTCMGFATYFLLSKLGSMKEFKWKIPFLSYARIALSAFIMGFCLWVLIGYVKPSLYILGILVIVGIIIYGLCLFISGEITNEIKFFKKFLKKRAN